MPKSNSIQMNESIAFLFVWCIDELNTQNNKRKKKSRQSARNWKDFSNKFRWVHSFSRNSQHKFAKSLSSFTLECAYQLFIVQCVIIIIKIHNFQIAFTFTTHTAFHIDNNSYFEVCIFHIRTTIFMIFIPFSFFLFRCWMMKWVEGQIKKQHKKCVNYNKNRMIIIIIIEKETIRCERIEVKRMNFQWPRQS